MSRGSNNCFLYEIPCSCRSSTPPLVFAPVDESVRERVSSMQMTELLVRHLKTDQRWRWLVAIATVSSYKTRTPHVRDARHVTADNDWHCLSYCIVLQAIFLIVEITHHWLNRTMMIQTTGPWRVSVRFWKIEKIGRIISERSIGHIAVADVVLRLCAP